MKTFTLEKKPHITSGFIVPENYFESFSAKIIPQLQEKQTQRFRFFKLQKGIILTIAAVFVIAFSSIIFYQLNDRTEIDAVVLEDYLTSNLIISEQEIAGLMDDKDFEKIKSELNIRSQFDEKELLEMLNIENYLTH